MPSTSTSFRSDPASTSPELWTLIRPWHPGGLLEAGYAAECAAQAEQEGWDGLLVADGGSQGTVGNVYISLAMAVAGTERVQLATGVTNPGTRHAIVTASAMGALQAESGGRMVLGMGRGDSALAYLGAAPVPVDAFADYLREVQAYLNGTEVIVDPEATSLPGLSPLAHLRLGGVPESVRIRLDRAMPKVPLDVAATGQRVITTAACLAERVTLALGAEPERIRWGIETARAAREAAGLDPDRLSLGAFVNVAAHPDVATARELIRGVLASFVRFSVMEGRLAAPVPDEDRDTVERVRQAYDLRMHAQAGAAQGALLPDEFVDRWAVVGPPEACVRRLRNLAALGLDRLVLVGNVGGGDPVRVGEAHDCLVTEVLPALGRAELQRRG